MVLEWLRHYGVVMDGEVTQSERGCFYALQLAAIGTAWIHPPPFEEDSACPCEEPECRLKKGAEKKSGTDIDIAEQTELQQPGPHVEVPIWAPVSV